MRKAYYKAQIFAMAPVCHSRDCGADKVLPSDLFAGFSAWLLARFAMTEQSAAGLADRHRGIFVCHSKQGHVGSSPEQIPPASLKALLKVRKLICGENLVLLPAVEYHTRNHCCLHTLWG